MEKEGWGLMDEEKAIDKQAIVSEANAETVQPKKKRKITNIPALSYEESLVLANAIWEFASGQRIRRLTLFDSLGKAPDSGPSRSLITASSKYGITTGGYQADFIELSSVGTLATDPEGNPLQKLKASFELAIASNDYFNSLYEAYKEMKLPANNVMVDFLAEKGLDKQESKKCIELFLNNARFLGLIKLLSGSERVMSLDFLVEEYQKNGDSVPTTKLDNVIQTSAALATPYLSTDSTNTWETTCFYITPIGGDGTEERKHSDLFLSSIVEPALEDFGLKVVRADKISNPGMITSQVIEHIHKSKLVIADLSFNNPNVYYELSFRHSFNLPTIHIIRKQDKIPFDVHDFRTIIIDTTDIYTLVPQLESYRSEISRQVRTLLENPDAMENPISAYLEKIKKIH